MLTPTSRKLCGPANDETCNCESTKTRLAIQAIVMPRPCNSSAPASFARTRENAGLTVQQRARELLLALGFKLVKVNLARLAKTTLVEVCDTSVDP